MKTFKLAVPSFTFLAAALMLGACVGADGEAQPQPGPAPVAPWHGIPRPEIAQVLQEHPDGIQINENEVSFDDGNVVLTIPNQANPSEQDAEARVSGAHGCPGGKWCFYEHDQFNGRRLTFGQCYQQYLSDYGFPDATTSWVNRSGHTIDVYDFDTGFLWREDPYSESSNVGGYANDKADYFVCY